MVSTATAVDPRAAIIDALRDNGTRPGRLRRIQDTLGLWHDMPAFIVILNGLPLRAATAADVDALVGENQQLAVVINIAGLAA